MLELGSPGYLAPERLLGSVGVDARTDLWSLGVVLFEMLTGRRLFASPTVMETCDSVLSARIPCVLDLRPALQVGLASIVERCLAAEPGKSHLVRRGAAAGALAVRRASAADERERHRLRRVPDLALWPASRVLRHVHLLR